MTWHSFACAVPLGCALLLAACGGSGEGGSSSPGTGPSPIGSGCAVTVTGLPSLVQGQGGSFAFAVASASSCTWTAQTDVAWADVAPRSGQGNGTPMLTVGANASPAGRSFTVSVNGQAFHVTQNNGCSYTVTPTSLNATSDGGSASFSLTALSGCPWTATASETWIRVLTPSGSGSATVNFDILPNSGGVRHATVTIAGRRIEITQEAR